MAAGGRRGATRLHLEWRRVSSPTESYSVRAHSLENRLARDGRARDRRVVPVDLVELRSVLEHSRKRVIHIFAGATIALFPFEFVGIAVAPSGLVGAVAWAVVARAGVG